MVVFYIYKHTTPNGKVYIGFTSQKPEERWAKGRGYRTQKVFYRAINKYGWENITHEIIDEASSLEEAREKEKEYIQQFNSNNKEFGYNLTAGGEGTLGYRLPKELVEQISKRMKEQQNTPEAKLKVSKEAKERWKDEKYKKMMASRSSKRQKEYYSTHPHKGSPLDRTGYHHSDDNKEKMSDIKRERIKNNPEYREKVVESLKKARGARKNYSTQPKGADHKRSKAVRCIETGVVYVNAREACRQTGINYNSISMVCNHRILHTAGGYHWEFVNEEVNETEE